MTRPNIALSCLILATVVGCGSAAQPPRSEDDAPILNDPGHDDGADAPVLAASSDKVKQGMDAIQAGDFKGAVSILSEAHQAAPDDPQAAYYLGVAQEGVGDKAAALPLYVKALELDAKLTEASVNLSALQLENNQLDAALKTVEAALKIAPKHPGLLMNHALILEAQGNVEAAVSAYGRAVEAAPDNVQLRFAHAELLVKVGKRDLALKQLDELSTASDPAVLAAAGGLLGKLEAWPACIATLTKAIDKRATAELLWRRGLCRHGAGEKQAEVADYEAALKLDDKSAPAHYYLGMALKASGDRKGALAHLEASIKVAEKAALAERARAAIAELKKKK